MKKRIPVLLALACALLAMLFLGLWLHARQDASRPETLALAGAQEAAARFADFVAHGADGDYWGGVAAFHVFQQASALLPEQPGDAANRTLCSELYGALLLAPAQAKPHASELAEILTCLSENVRDRAAYERLAVLRNALLH